MVVSNTLHVVLDDLNTSADVGQLKQVHAKLEQASQHGVIRRDAHTQLLVQCAEASIKVCPSISCVLCFGKPTDHDDYLWIHGVQS